MMNREMMTPQQVAEYYAQQGRSAYARYGKRGIHQCPYGAGTFQEEQWKLGFYGKPPPETDETRLHNEIQVILVNSKTAPQRFRGRIVSRYSGAVYIDTERCSSLRAARDALLALAGEGRRA